LGASLFIWCYEPPYKPHFGVGFWGLLLDFLGRRLNKKGLYFKAFRMFLDVFESEFGGGGGN